MKKLVSLVIVGIAVKYFLDSESGKDIKRQLHDWLGDVQDLFSKHVDAAKKELASAGDNIPR